MKSPLLPTCQFCSFLQSLLYVLGEREIQEGGGGGERRRVRRERRGKRGRSGEKDETRDKEKEEVRKEKKWGRVANLTGPGTSELKLASTP